MVGREGVSSQGLIPELPSVTQEPKANVAHVGFGMRLRRCTLSRRRVEFLVDRGDAKLAVDRLQDRVVSFVYSADVFSVAIFDVELVFLQAAEQ